MASRGQRLRILPAVVGGSTKAEAGSAAELAPAWAGVPGGVRLAWPRCEGTVGGTGCVGGPVALGKGDPGLWGMGSLRPRDCGDANCEDTGP